MLAVATTVDPYTEACGAPGDRRWLCQLFWERTDSHALARVGHYLSPWLTSLLILLVAIIVNRIARWFVRRATDRLVSIRPGTDQTQRSRRAHTIAAAMSSITSIVIGIIVLFSVLAAFGVNITPLLAGAGLAGVALGFGAQNLLRDVLAGAFMIIEDQFNVGDRVDTGLATGRVEAITLRVTTLRDDDGVVWHVPNGQINRVANLSARRAPA